MKWYKGVVMQVLMTEIETAREHMVMLGLTEGLTSRNTVRISQTLDYLLNELSKVMAVD
ncbi:MULTISPECIES: aspartyl-phosphate phosphatase Spo0E family protein [Priestia]|uniref:Aspartyl-phosphate phosphatase Spo0E family protein n=1 Tax=Priestia aryabhattai TaxID=412384 RepID=A0AAX6N7R5_PRIAR|nr:MULTISPECIES: aspartyl-phosphate phosphatase Spo0E family protein [Priestia]MDM8150798.1 aspartyl-phosphate phosphatase Spo0E family protein [Priestia megaterium]MDN3363626.1 aspartyl-phosphate phosphatase Spo0E family protein [Priestia megaterium]MDU9691829.1 aspartyl-phosphate phosphatase Spo0E family protein [Priestia aryabhattai]MEB4868451.1 aspartyl-phosphate phosphatase Spo0E family protein [Priestia megaterium]MED3940331.1 aspartyl-phosphate phosphatase Spo0E family protein [Priestia